MNIIKRSSLLFLAGTMSCMALYSQDYYSFKGNNGKYGFKDVYGKIVIPAKFESVWDFKGNSAQVEYNGGFGFIDKEGNYYKSQDDLEKGLKEGSWTAYLASELGSKADYMRKKGIDNFNETALKNKVQAEINKWQEKGEFESTAMWQQRVNEKTRDAKAKELAKQYADEYNRKYSAASEEYERQYKAVADKFSAIAKKKFASQSITLKPYDADNQTFLISTERFGDILLPVPMSEAPAFKANWEAMRSKVTSEFVLVNDQLALKSVAFGKYVYDSNTRANYAQVDADYNFKPIDLSGIRYDFNDIASNETKPSISTPDTKNLITPSKVEVSKNHVTIGGRADVDINIPLAETSRANTFAVVIANADYEHASEVKNARNDGEVMTEYLVKTLGIPAKNVNTYYNATYGKMLDAVLYLQSIAKAYGKDNFNVIFYYVGHGFPDENSFQSYLLPTDANPKNTRVCYSLSDLYGQLGKLDAKSVTVLLDACFSGTNHGEGMLVAQSMGVAMKPLPSDPVGNMVVLSAAQGNETAYPYESKNHGLFTYWLLKKLQDTKGNVTMGELADFVISNVLKTSVVENRKEQTPSVATSGNLTDWKTRKF